MHAARICEDMKSFGVEVHRIGLADPCVSKWELLVAPPDVSPVCENTALFTMNESSELFPKQVEAVLKAKLVFVPCNLVEEFFNAQDIDVIVIPLGIDTSVFRPRPMDMAGPCVFLAAGSLAGCGVRKNISGAIEAFQLAFPSDDDVLLDIKCAEGDVVNTFDDRRVNIIKAGWITDNGMRSCFSSTTAYVSGSLGEGWGLMAHQAMAVGRPVISPDYGFLWDTPQDDYYYVPCDLGEFLPTLYAGEMDRFIMDDMIRQMRSVYEDRETARQKGLRLIQKAHELSWVNSNIQLYDVLRGNGVLCP